MCPNSEMRSQAQTEDPVTDEVPLLRYHPRLFQCPVQERYLLSDLVGIRRERLKERALIPPKRIGNYEIQRGISCVLPELP